MSKSVMKHQFSQVPTVDIPRSVFNRDHTHKTTFNAGELIPSYIDEVLPGDSINLNMTLFGRLATPIAPIMDNVFLDTHFFFVPLRLIHDNFKKMMGEQANPTDTIDYLVPQFKDDAGSGFAEGSLEDYMGLPTLNQATGLEVSAYWRRAYGLIWNEWFRDQNLQDSVVVNTGDGPDNMSSADTYQLLRRGKRHDYFTSALPWPQKGHGVDLPLGGTAPVLADGTLQLTTSAGATTSGLRKTTQSGGAAQHDAVWASSGYISTGTQASYHSGLITDLSSATPVTINDLREAFQLQKLAEKDARGGTRYTEIVRSHFNVVSPDARLQRPEFLGGGTTRLQVTPVAQTSAQFVDISSAQTTPQGNLSGYGTFASNGDGFTKSFTEHGVIIGLVSARADLTYQNGVNRMFDRKTKYDFYWPTLAHLGEQEVKNSEIYATGNAANDEGTFGYQERWAEYRYYPSKITGKFRSDATGSLDLWHLSQEFASTPTLGDTFIQDNPPIDRILAVTNEPQFILDSHIQCRTARPMPTYSVPGLVDHF